MLRLVTIPTVHQNLSQCLPPYSVQCRYFSGDWDDVTPVMGKALGDRRYDVILTSETVYKTETYDKLHHLLSSLLSTDGAMYLFYLFFVDYCQHFIVRISFIA